MTRLALKYEFNSVIQY